MEIYIYKQSKCNIALYIDMVASVTKIAIALNVMNRADFVFYSSGNNLLLSFCFFSLLQTKKKIVFFSLQNITWCLKHCSVRRFQLHFDSKICKCFETALFSIGNQRFFCSTQLKLT